jgi:BirA family biotin operon repressor/biotin-[acetyl-CoA-carboxylase] ligase
MDTPYSLIIQEVTASTQDDARAAFEGAPVLVVAARQTAGRGRAGTAWENAPRAVAASLAFDPGWPTDRRPLVALLAGLAAARVIDVDLKWPNDLISGGRKVGGVLAEAGPDAVVVGLGVNLWWPDAPDGFGGLHSDDPGSGRGVRVAERWAAGLLRLSEGGWEAWPRHEYVERCVTVGSEITWTPDGRGRAVDVEADGSLVVDTEVGPVRLRSGEVRHVRPASEG